MKRAVIKIKVVLAIMGVCLLKTNGGWENRILITGVWTDKIILEKEQRCLSRVGSWNPVILYVGKL